MKRKIFLKQTVTAAPFLAAYNPMSAISKSFLKHFIRTENKRQRVLVLIELNGGNDGLNTVIPIDKYHILSQPNVRRDILIPENKILRLHDTDVFGFHPSMKGLQKLYNDNLVTVVQGVGHPNLEFSHFIAKEVKYTAHIEKMEIKSGWVGRYLYQEYPTYPTIFPYNKTDGPPAIRFGEVSSLLTQFTPPIVQDIDDLSIGISNLSDLSYLETDPEDEWVDNSLGRANIRKVRAVSEQIRLYAPVIQSFIRKQQNLSKFYPEPGKNLLADQLKSVARLIGSGLNTPVYMVCQTGYDTHAEQVDKSDTTLGIHARLLKDLSEAIYAFEDDLHLMGRQDDVLGMTFSEFGRRIVAGSYGTDHGTSETMLLFGTKLKSGVIGESPKLPLPSVISYDDNLAVQFDFRSVYKTVLREWFGVDNEKIKTIFPQGPDEKLSLFST